jgi:hypothetical protein
LPERLHTLLCSGFLAGIIGTILSSSIIVVSRVTWTKIMEHISQRVIRQPFRIATLLFIFVVIVLVAWSTYSNVAAATDVGYRDFSYPPRTGENSEPTGEKPESKLWWNDGIWWGSLWSTSGNAYHIYRLNLATQSWIDTGTAIDDRRDSRADALWDGQKLYVASHIFAKNSGAPASSGQRGELFRYSYNSVTKSYSLDTGFPVEITGGESETLVIDKDSNGALWATWVESRKVMVNHSLNGNDATWGVPYVLPVGSAADVNSDDISSVIAYSQHIGIMWSSQKGGEAMYFAVHPDSAPDNVWTNLLAYGVSGDDHLSLKSLEADSAGNVFAAIKTSNSSAVVVVLVCENNINRCKNASNWASHTVYSSTTTSPTRPIMVIDESNRELMVFTRNSDDGQEGIYYKIADMDNIQFPAGLGTPFINLASDPQMNDPTSTKQNVNATTGLVVLASDSSTKYYVHNYMPLATGSEPVVNSFSPTSGVVGAEVTIGGSRLINTTQVSFGGTPAVSFTIDSDSQIRAIVPSGAMTGKIAVTNSSGTGFSANDFIVIVAPSILSFAPMSGLVGTEVTVTGSGFSGATQVDFNGLPASSFAVDSDSQIRADVPNGAASGPISVVNPAGSDTSTGDFTVEYLVEYSLTMNTVGSGSVTANPPGGLYGEGVQVDLTATPDPGSYFVGWSGDLAGSANPSQLTMDADKIVTATFSVSIMFESASYSESEANDSATITVSLSSSTDKTVTVNYATADGTAVADSDYEATSGLVIFSPGDTAESFSVPIIDDVQDEFDETIRLALSSPTNASLGSRASSALIIVDDDAAPTVQFGSASYSVGEGEGTAVVQATLSTSSGHSISVGYSTLSGTAVEGMDYDEASGILMFPSGVISQSINVSIVDDTLHEGDEMLRLSLHDPVNASLGLPEAAPLTIVDNEDPLEIQFESGEYDAVEDEGIVEMAVALSATAELTVTVEATVVGGTAKVGIDFTGPATSLTFAPGTTVQFLQIALTDDSEIEPQETVFLGLSDPHGATLATTDLAKLTIADDDGTVTYLAILRR